jgi:hypothetical protein
MDAELKVWLGNLPANLTPSAAKDEIASHGFERPRFVKVLKSKTASKHWCAVVTMPTVEAAQQLLEGALEWSNGKHAVIRLLGLCCANTY